MICLQRGLVAYINAMCTILPCVTNCQLDGTFHCQPKVFYLLMSFSHLAVLTMEVLQTVRHVNFQDYCKDYMSIIQAHNVHSGGRMAY